MLAARCGAHRFAPHIHPVFAIGCVESGACRVWHQGRPRIRLSVRADGAPAVELLDEAGRVASTLANRSRRHCARRTEGAAHARRCRPTTPRGSDGQEAYVGVDAFVAGHEWRFSCRLIRRHSWNADDGLWRGIPGGFAPASERQPRWATLPRGRSTPARWSRLRLSVAMFSELASAASTAQVCATSSLRAIGCVCRRIEEIRGSLLAAREMSSKCKANGAPRSPGVPRSLHPSRWSVTTCPTRYAWRTCPVPDVRWPRRG